MTQIRTVPVLPFIHFSTLLSSVVVALGVSSTKYHASSCCKMRRDLKRRRAQIAPPATPMVLLNSSAGRRTLGKKSASARGRPRHSSNRNLETGDAEPRPSGSVLCLSQCRETNFSLPPVQMADVEDVQIVNNDPVAVPVQVLEVVEVLDVADVQVVDVPLSSADVQCVPDLDEDDLTDLDEEDLKDNKIAALTDLDEYDLQDNKII